MERVAVAPARGGVEVRVFLLLASSEGERKKGDGHGWKWEPPIPRKFVRWRTEGKGDERGIFVLKLHFFFSVLINEEA